jgi:hypothetical protein
MDVNRFDKITRVVGTRRSVLVALLGGISLLGPYGAAARNKGWRKRKCGRKKIRVSCEDNCRTYKISNCRSKWKRCTCPNGKICLANDFCGLNCAAKPCPEGSGCTCSTTDPKVCLAPFTTCEEVPTRCETTADCPFRFSCDQVLCGEGGVAEKRCLPLCGYSP